MAKAFGSVLEVAKRVAIHLGSTLPTTLTDDRKFVTVFNALYDKSRRAELRRHVWTFAIRRAMLRPVTTTSGSLAVLAWSAVTTYGLGDIISYGGEYWIALATSLNVTPVDGASWEAYTGALLTDAWSAAITYYNGDLVKVSSTIYICISSTLNNTPPNATYWHAVAGASQGVNSSLVLAPVNLQNDFSGRFVFMLPARYIRLTSQDPKSANAPRLSVSAEMRYNDWEIERFYLLSSSSTAIVFRFVADCTDFLLLEDLFCEALAARIAMESAETITQSKEKIDQIAGIYTGFIRQAHEQNAIELGSTEDPENPEQQQPPQPAPEKQQR